MRLGKADDLNTRSPLGRSLGQPWWAAHAVTTEAAECHLRSSIPDAARSRDRQVAAWMRRRSRCLIARQRADLAAKPLDLLGGPGSGQNILNHIHVL